MTKSKQGTIAVHRGALNELHALKLQIDEAQNILKHAVFEIETLTNLFQSQLRRAEGKAGPKAYLVAAEHMFGLSHPAKQGLNHTASAYRVCRACGHSDVYLKANSEGRIPPCQVV